MVADGDQYTILVSPQLLCKENSLLKTWLNIMNALTKISIQQLTCELLYHHDV
jgi:hypothetical protein